MIVPFIYNLEVTSDYDHITVFYFYLMMSKKFGGPIISHERYFMKPTEIYLKIVGKEELKSAADTLEFDIPEDKDLDNIKKYFITQKFEDKMINAFESQMDCWTCLLSEEYAPFEELIGQLLDRIERECNDKIEAILCFYEPISLRIAADKRNIKVIHQEGTMFRKPFYRMAGYFDFKEGYGCGELEERYCRFKEEIKNKKIKLFSRKEICALFMTSYGLNYIDLMDAEPTYEMGVGLADFSRGVNLKDGLINTDEILLEARKNFPLNEIRTRSRYGGGVFNDKSPSAFHFILKCKRVAALHSNLSFEAMLLNRIAYVYGKSPYRFIANKNISDKSDKNVPLDFINFTTFGYFVPWELLRDTEYIRWRLTQPSEIEIYEKHMEFYLQDRGVIHSLQLEPGMALKYILSTQNVKVADKDEKVLPLLDKYEVLSEEYKTLNGSYKLAVDNYDKLNMEYKKLLDAYNIAIKNYDKLNQEHKEVIEAYNIAVENYDKLNAEYKKLL